MPRQCRPHARGKPYIPVRGIGLQALQAELEEAAQLRGEAERAGDGELAAEFRAVEARLQARRPACSASVWPPHLVPPWRAVKAGRRAMCALKASTLHAPE